MEPFDPRDKELRVQAMARDMIVYGDHDKRDALITASWFVSESERRLQCVEEGEEPVTEPFRDPDDEPDPEGDDDDDDPDGDD
jgi:hypothetical protein